MEKKTTQEITALTNRIAEILDAKKALDIEVLDVSEKTTLADKFVICSANSTTAVKALASEVEFKIKEEYDLAPQHTEGFSSRRWVLLDYIDIVVHIFLAEDRDFYSLERLWKTSPRTAE